MQNSNILAPKVYLSFVDLGFNIQVAFDNFIQSALKQIRAENRKKRNLFLVLRKVIKCTFYDVPIV